MKRERKKKGSRSAPVNGNGLSHRSARPGTCLDNWPQMPRRQSPSSNDSIPTLRFQKPRHRPMLPTPRVSLVTPRTTWRKQLRESTGISKLKSQSLTAFACPPPTVVASAFLSYLFSFASFHCGTVRPLILVAPSRIRNMDRGLFGLHCDFCWGGGTRRAAQVKRDAPLRVMAKLMSRSGRQYPIDCHEHLRVGCRA